MMKVIVRDASDGMWWIIRHADADYSFRSYNEAVAFARSVTQPEGAASLPIAETVDVT